jgi:hypothetical protein
MKNLFKKIVILVVSVTILLIPTSTVLAASTPVVIYNNNGVTFYEYQPDRLHLASDTTHFFLNALTNTYTWSVPAGKSMYFSFVFDEDSATVFSSVIASDGSGCTNTLTSNTHSFSYRFPIKSYDVTYQFAFSSLSDITIRSYCTAIQ